MANKQNPKSVIMDSLRGDAQFKKFRLIVSKTRERFKVESDRKEALSLHASRTSRTLHGDKRYSPIALMDASLKDLSFRARLVEIRVQITLHTALLEEAVTAIKRYIRTEYYDELNNYKTVDSRSALVDRLVASALDLQNEGSALIELLDTLIEDIDKASFHLKHMLDCLQLLDSSKGKIV